MTTAPNSDNPTDRPRHPGLEALSVNVSAQLGEAGLAVVPRSPTPRMVEAGRLAGNGDPAMAAAIFAAMMDAAD